MSLKNSIVNVHNVALITKSDVIHALLIFLSDIFSSRISCPPDKLESSTNHTRCHAGNE